MLANALLFPFRVLVAAVMVVAMPIWIATLLVVDGAEDARIEAGIWCGAIGDALGITSP